MPGFSKEHKFVGWGYQAERALHMTAQHCLRDARYPQNRISSIYYDTVRLRSFVEKVEGDVLKEKIRLRWYGDDNAAPGRRQQVFLEVKYRAGSARQKTRVQFDVDRDWLETTPLEDGRLIRLLYDKGVAVGDLMPLDVAPVICIRYERHRFTCPRTGAGVCVDVNIRADRGHSGVLPSRMEARMDAVVCEIKGAALRDIPLAEELYAAGLRLRNFSKYGECVNQMLSDGGRPLWRS